ncbi:hypothetical protein BCR32DRAFT_293629 [Anaeromyces robustus]|uniref:Uncharacterized protein n=1 Tax=Anaeromyces robustus TaxID=1754192 RepID=A0A1Y1X4T5_9FUNG|nr:hypothetical protein BCR32DRAFT_293629 [Anaeromyces robustus]|eukprot:ORX80831.1 hypothetical protein BCR32DRAFT_293629 [Anaeromyces robustus]
MKNIIKNIYTNCTFNEISNEILSTIFLKNNNEVQSMDSKFPNHKIVLNLPEDKQKPIIEIKDKIFFIPKHLYIQSNIRNIELYINEEYIKTIRGEQINVESICYYVHSFDFNSSRNTNSIKVKFISSAGAESICIYNFNLLYENTEIKVSPNIDTSIDFNSVREMLSGIQISDDAKNMLNNIESSSKMFNLMGMGNFNSNEISSSFFSMENTLPQLNVNNKGNSVTEQKIINETNAVSKEKGKEKEKEQNNETEIISYLKRIESRMDTIEAKLDLILSKIQ